MTRDVHGLLVLFVMPAVFILIMSMALRDTFKLSVVEKIRWQYWDEDRSEISAAFLKHLPAVDVSFTLHDRGDLDRARIRDGVGRAGDASSFDRGFSCRDGASFVAGADGCARGFYGGRA